MFRLWYYFHLVTLRDIVDISQSFTHRHTVRYDMLLSIAMKETKVHRR